MRIDELLAGDSFKWFGQVRTVTRMEHHLDEGTVSIHYTTSDCMAHMRPTVEIDGVIPEIEQAFR